MRWIGRSTHDASDIVPMDRSWWMWSKFALGGVICFVVALPIGLAVGAVVGETLKLHLEVKQAELERLEAENAASRGDMAPDGREDGG